MMVHKTKQVGFEPVFESLHSWNVFYGGWNSIPNLGITVAEGTPTKISYNSWSTVQLLTGRAQGSRGLETEVNVDKQVGVWIESCR